MRIVKSPPIIIGSPEPDTRLPFDDHDADVPGDLRALNEDLSWAEYYLEEAMNRARRDLPPNAVIALWISMQFNAVVALRGALLKEYPNDHDT
jgi:hypothetical protein